MITRRVLGAAYRDMAAQVDASVRALWQVRPWSS